MTLRRLCFALALIGLVASAARGDGDPGVHYRFDLVLDQDEELLRGEGTIRLRNDGGEPLVTLPLVLYPNRFLREDQGINDVNYDRFYVRWFDEGSLTLTSVASASGAALQVAYPDLAGLPGQALAQVRLPSPVPPGQWAEVRVAFVLDVPDRLGTFGVRHERFVLEAGAMPYVPSPGPEGPRDWYNPPQPGRYDLGLEVTSDDPAEPEGVFLGAAPFDEQRGADGRVTLDTTSPLLVVGDDLFELADAEAKNGTPRVRVFGEEGDDDRTLRIVEIARSAGTYARRFLGPESKGQLTFVQAPLRDRFVHATDQAVLYSDRLFHLFFLLKGFHELEVARGAVQSLVRQALAGEPLGMDRDWICEGFAWVILQEWLNTRSSTLSGDDIRSGLRFLDVIPVVDGLLRAPKFAGADLYYGRIHEIWVDVPDGFSRALWRRQRGRIPLEKLRDKIGTDALLALVKDSLAPGALAERGFRERSEEVLGQPADPFFELWLERPSPTQNLAFEELETIEELPDGQKRIRVRLRRDGEDAERVGEVGEPVTVGSKDAEGEKVTAVWNGQGLEGQIELVYGGGWFDKVVIDPDNRVDQWRGDDERPRFAKLLINRFRVRIDLNRGNRNEAAIGFTLIPNYDYQHAITVDAFAQQDEAGIDLGYGYGFGWTLDERRYGLGVGTNLNVTDLSTGVIKNDAIEETEGSLVSFGAGFGFDTRIDRFSPTWGFGLSGNFEYADKVFGTDFRFLVLNGSASFVYSLWRGTSIGAQLRLGQVEGREVPTQRQFDVGGEGGVRGVRTSFFVDNAQFVVRTELRQMLIEDLDIPLLWFVWVRKVQLFGFLDTGNVAPTIDKIVVPQEDWKWGAGGGIRLHLDGLGVSRFVLGFSVGVRLDATSDDLDPQFYFGGGQSF